ncbi:MAG: hypothetical protein RLZZ15_1815, partial [Verrucomicrobiota bacterium]|jgi:hypothetical protein
VRIGGVARNFSYDVTVFDPEVASAGADAAPVTIIGPESVEVGKAASYAVSKPSFAGGIAWRQVALGGAPKSYDAEAGLDGLVAVANADYPVVQTAVAGAGRAAYRLAHSTRTTQSLTLPDNLYVSAPNAALNFLSRLGFATPIQVAHVQVSADDGNSWLEVYTQAGTGDATGGELAFQARSVSLAAFEKRTVRVRFAYTVALNGLAFPQTVAGVGWYLDNISLVGTQVATAGPVTTVPAGSNFSFSAASAGGVALQARGMLFEAFPLEWGRVAALTVSEPIGSIINPARLINLSIVTQLAAGETSFSMGTVLGGAGTSGPKALLARAAGPSLAAFGVGGTLPDPTMALLGAGGVTVATNDNWGGDPNLANAFQQVGAFAYANAATKDAAVFQPALPGGNYAVQVSDAGAGTGTVIAELYDATPANAFTARTPRLLNVSIIKNIGSGLAAGFVIGGVGRKTVLIRAVGPSLTAFGLSASTLLADPKLELIDAAKRIVGANDNWGGDAALATALTAAFGQVGAFALANPASKDAALLVTLDPGSYSVSVAGVSGTSGIALVEVYDVP